MVAAVATLEESLQLKQRPAKTNQLRKVSFEKRMEDSPTIQFSRVCQKSAKSENGREPYALHEVVDSLRHFDKKMVGAWGFEPQTPTVSR